ILLRTPALKDTVSKLSDKRGVVGGFGVKRLPWRVLAGMIHSHPNRTIPDLRRNCLPSCLKYSLSWLHPLRSWSLRQTRRGSKTQACVHLSAIEHNRLILNGWSKRNSRPRPSRSPIALIRPETKPSMRMSHYTKNLE